VAFDFLSDALQTATHRQYVSLLAERTLKPLRMYNTTFFPSTVQCDRLLRSAHDEGPCTSTEQTAGSSGLYSTAGDMGIWLKYLLGTGAIAQNPAAQAVYIQSSKLMRQQGLDHAGEPSGVGLGWIHLLTADDPSHIVEKTGGGAGFLTYIAINHARHAAVFFAATDGPDRPKSVVHGAGVPEAQAPHLNSFYAANNLLLAVSGLPPLPPPPARPVAVRAHKRARARRQKR
jgi:D-alanyl-D-alanine-carboxypeptidase/D-alanyl-D-alanine-endopeptidase